MADPQEVTRRKYLRLNREPSRVASRVSQSSESKGDFYVSDPYPESVWSNYRGYTPIMQEGRFLFEIETGVCQVKRM